MKHAVLFLIAFVMGALCSLILMNYLRQATAYPNGVMAVMGAQMKSLDEALKANRCSAADLIPRLQTLRFVGNDIEPAFPGMDEPERFAAHASTLRAAVDAALAGPPASCQAADAALTRIGNACQACHRDYKS
jgi:hypothetical protein